MGSRGMLPKFRPAKLDAEAPTALRRPTIRPVKPSAPPPPPVPPRRMTSGFGRKGELTGDETAAYEDGPTMSPLVEQHQVHEDETRMQRVDDDLIAATRSPSDDDLLTSLPSLEARRPFDAYEAAFAERDPETQLYAATYPAKPEPAPVTERYVPPAAAPEPPRAQAFPRALKTPSYDHRVGSWPPDAEAMARSRPSSAPDVAQPMIPRAPAIPREMRVPANFVMGVQPIKTPPQPAQPVWQPPPDPSGPHRMPPPEPSGPHMQMSAFASGPYAMPPRSAAPSPAAQPASRGARLAYFVIGTTFGICFAFFATGFVPSFLKKEESVGFPAPPPPPTLLAPLPAAPAAPPTANVAPAPVTPAALPATTPATKAATAPARGSKPSASARRTTPSSNAPKAMPGSGTVGNDDEPAPPRRYSPPASGGAAAGDIPAVGGGDILGAALK